jgi:hypothetical protein
MYGLLYCIHVKKSRAERQGRASAGGFVVRIISTEFIEEEISHICQVDWKQPCIYHAYCTHVGWSVLTNRYFSTSQMAAWHQASVLLITRYYINPGKHTSALALEMEQGHEKPLESIRYPLDARRFPTNHGEVSAVPSPSSRPMSAPSACRSRQPALSAER